MNHRFAASKDKPESAKQTSFYTFFSEKISLDILYKSSACQVGDSHKMSTCIFENKKKYLLQF